MAAVLQKCHPMVELDVLGVEPHTTESQGKTRLCHDCYHRYRSAIVSMPVVDCLWQDSNDPERRTPISPKCQKCRISGRVRSNIVLSKPWRNVISFWQAVEDNYGESND